MFRRALLSFAAALVATVGLGATPASAGEPADLLPVCDQVGHECGSTVGDGDAQVLAQRLGVNIGATLEPEDVDRLVDAATTVRTASTTAATAGHDALAPVCKQVGHHCGSTVGDGDAQVLAKRLGINIGSSVEPADVERLLAVAQRVKAASLAITPVDSVWDRLAQCESGGRWSYNGGSGYDGGLQFHPSTWRAYAPASYPDYAWQATREQQIAVAEKVLAAQGWGAWPACSSKLGLR